MTEVTIAAGGVHLAGDLTIPSAAPGVVIFVNDAGSSRFASRNRMLAARLQQRGLATLVFDLLTPEEVALDRRTRLLRFDAGKLGRRVVFVTDWLRAYAPAADLELGYFGTSIGAAAALIAASHHPDRIKAVVSHCGRPDLAIEVLPKVRAATLLTVTANDPMLMQFNKHAYGYLRCEKQLDVVPPAEDVSVRAADWFVAHCGVRRLAAAF